MIKDFVAVNDNLSRYKCMFYILKVLRHVFILIYFDLTTRQGRSDNATTRFCFQNSLHFKNNNIGSFCWNVILCGKFILESKIISNVSKESISEC